MERNKDMKVRSLPKLHIYADRDTVQIAYQVLQIIGKKKQYNKLKYKCRDKVF